MYYILNLLYYITFLNQWNFAESHPTTANSAGSSHTSSLIHVALDLNATQSTNEFDFSDHNGVITYIPKDNYVFSKVSQGTNAVWESIDDAYGTLVRTKTIDNVKYLVILLTDNLFKLFHLDNNEWKDITSDRHDLSRLKFFGENDTEITASDYKVTSVDFFYTFMFKASVKCMKVTYSNTPLWNPSDDPKFSTITTFDFDLLSNKFYVTNSSDQLKQLKNTLISLDIEKTQSTNEFDYSEHNGVVTYTPKSGYVFSKLSQGTTGIWESKTNLCATLVMSKSEDNVKYLAMLLTNNMFTLFNFVNNDWQNITSKRPDVSRLRFIGENGTVISKTDYKVTLENDSYTITFNSGVICKKVLYEEDVWKHDEDTQFSSLKSFSLGLCSKRFYVKNQSGHFKKLNFKPHPRSESTPASDLVTPSTTSAKKTSSASAPTILLLMYSITITIITLSF